MDAKRQDKRDETRPSTEPEAHVCDPEVDIRKTDGVV